MKSRGVLFFAVIWLVGAGCSSTVTAIDAGGDVLSTVDQGVDGAIALDVVPQDVAPDIGRDVPGDQPDVQSVDVLPVDVPDALSMCPIEPVVPPTSACAGLCGNGHVDMCSTCAPCPPRGGPPAIDGGVCCTSAAESCDGTDLAGTTCASAGFVSGSMACGSTCHLDTHDCNECLTGAHITNCTEPDVPVAGTVSLALAPGDGEIGVAWANPDTVYFARFGMDLTRHGDVLCFGPGSPRRVALAWASGAWVAAVDNPDGISVYGLSTTGGVHGPVGIVSGEGVPMLAVGSTGLLLVGTTSGPSGGDAVMAIRLTEEGVIASAPITVFNDPVEPEYGSVVGTNDGYLIAMRASAGAQIAHVSTSGVVTYGAALGEDTEYPQIAWTGTEARVTWADFGGTPTMRWSSVDSTGHLTGPTVALGEVPAYYDPCPVVTTNDTTVVLLAGYTGGTGMARRLDITELAADGTTTLPAYPVNASPLNAVSYRIATMGGSLVTAWLSNDPAGRMGLAMLTP